jgi:hypothetical protein
MHSNKTDDFNHLRKISFKRQPPRSAPYRSLNFNQLFSNQEKADTEFYRIEIALM